MRWTVALVVTFVSGAIAPQVVAQDASLVMDLHTGDGPVVEGMASAAARTTLVVDGVRYFAASDGVHGRELWRSDGTAAGTSLLRDIHRGAASSNPGDFIAFGTGFCFTADDGVRGRELWCSDLTSEGTQPVADIRPGPRGGLLLELIVHDGMLYFGADDGEHGRELWTSDGTAAGTRMVQDTRPGSFSGWEGFIGSLTSGLLFSGSDGSSSDRLLRTDGTAAGTVQVHPYAEPWGSLGSGDAAVYAGDAYFTEDYILWRSDGTEAGTDEIFLDPPSPDPRYLADSPAGLLFWDWNAADTGRVLWCLDNAFGAEELPVPQPPGVPEVGVVSGRAFVTGGTNRRLWRTGCTPGSTAEVAGGGITYNDVRGIAPLGLELFFRASGALVGAELHRYRSGGPVELVADIRPGSVGSDPAALIATGDALTFAANDGTHGAELWRWDATDGAALVANLAADGGSSRPRVLGTVNGRVVFSARRADVGRELFATDGSAGGTVLLADAYPGAIDGLANMDLRHHDAVLHDGYLYYAARSPDAGEELWRTDGTPAGTTRVADLCPGSCDGLDFDFVHDSMVSTGALLFFAAAPGPGFDARLWRSDGTAAGTFELAGSPEIPSDANRPIAVLDDLVLFAGEGTTGGMELWASDGTPGGTVLVREIRTSTPGGEPDWLTRVGEWIYFVADDGEAGRELWRTDGTPVRTRRVADILPGFANSHPHHLTAHGGVLYFSANDGSSGYELWRSDGTAEGTVRVADVAAGAASAWPRALVSTASGLFFSADDGASGPEPWLTDGTAGGTRRPLSIVPGPRDRLAAPFGGDGGELHRAQWMVPRSGSAADYAEPVEMLDTGDGRVVFRGCDDAFGCQLWITHAEADLGTVRLTDFGPTGGAAPGHLTLLDGVLYFAANAEASGRELWTLALPPRPDPLFRDGFEQVN